MLALDDAMVFSATVRGAWCNSTLARTLHRRHTVVLTLNVSLQEIGGARLQLHFETARRAATSSG